MGAKRGRTLIHQVIGDRTVNELRRVHQLVKLDTSTSWQQSILQCVFTQAGSQRSVFRVVLIASSYFVHPHVLTPGSRVIVEQSWRFGGRPADAVLTWRPQRHRDDVDGSSWGETFRASCVHGKKRHLKMSATDKQTDRDLLWPAWYCLYRGTCWGR